MKTKERKKLKNQMKKREILNKERKNYKVREKIYKIKQERGGKRIRKIMFKKKGSHGIKIKVKF